MIQITKMDNGYMIERSPPYGALPKVFTSLEDALSELLWYFEGLAPNFPGNSYGKIRIKRGTETDEG